jgi:hypothetical protein
MPTVWPPKMKYGYIYMNMLPEMYVLPQSGVLANKLLKKQLEKHDYYEDDHTQHVSHSRLDQYGLH